MLCQIVVGLALDIGTVGTTVFGLVTREASMHHLALVGLAAIPAVILLTTAVIMLRAKNGLLSETKCAADERCLKLLGLASELEQARERMADLYKVQLGGTKKRAEKLRKILDVASSMSSNLDIDTVLHGVVSSVRETLGFRIVLLRILNLETGLLEARAFAGLSVDARRKLESYPVAVEEFRSWLRPEFRVSNSYFISHTHKFWDSKDNEGSYVPDLGPRQEGEWHEEDVLFVPLVTRDDKLIAYLSVDDPADRLIPSRETVEMLEIFGAQAVAAIENARLYKELEDHSKRVEEAAERMREVNELKSNFVSTVSHELRTPLTSIKAYVETLLENVGAKNATMQREFLHIIDGETERLARLIDAILDLSQLESGTFKVRKEVFDVGEVIGETVDVLRSVASRRGIALNAELPDQAVLLEADRDLIKQVIINLGGNAVKFSREDGQVTLSAEQGAGVVKVSVRDTGVGIPKEQIERIFDRFYQVDSSAARQFGGAGLGLTICKSIVEWHGGTIEVESEEGEGSKFVVTFPQKAIETRAIANVNEHDDRTSESVAKLTVEMIAEIMNARTASLMLLDDELEELTISAALGLEDHVVKNTSIKIGESISGWVAKHGKPLLIANIEEDERFGKVNHPQYETKSLLSVPVMWDNEVIGVLNINNKVSCSPFTADDSVLLSCLAERVGLVCSNLESYKTTKEVAESTGDALKALIANVRRNRLKLCSGAFVSYAVEIARRMGMSKEQLGVMAYVASIHDVGMVKIGRRLVESSCRFGEKEMELLRRHPEEGIAIVKPIEFMEQVYELILCHHERVDGTGYPRGLRGYQIPLGARILAVVDAYESMRMGRPYREPLEETEAIEELRRCAGVQFDEEVVETLIQVVSSERMAGTVVSGVGTVKQLSTKKF